MTSKTSLFNRGIYRSTFRRFIWGSVVYAIILFLSSVLPILSDIDPADHWRIGSEPINSLLLTEFYLYIPLFFAAVIPTVAALLAFRFIHSKKHSIFVHSLPVSREANFISTSLAMLSLMTLPVILNGVFLAIMSLAAYGALFNLAGVLTWVGYNLFAIFIMFGAASFCASLTGNSFAFVGLNALLHLIAIIITAILSVFSVEFLYGYPNSTELVEVATKWNYVTYIFKLGMNYDFSAKAPIPFDWKMFAIIATTAVIFYVLALILCKKRRIETAEDIAAYKVFGPIFKYMLTFFAAGGVFAIFARDLPQLLIPLAITLLLVTAVIYFALEMIIRKTLKVWDSYKGFIAFLVCFAVFVSFFAFTTGFGYETRIPSAESIEAVSIDDYRSYGSEEKFSSSPEVIAYIRDMHEALIASEMRYITREFQEERYISIWIKYKLKNGREITRSYDVDIVTYHSYMSELFEKEGYRETFIAPFLIDGKEVRELEISHDRIGDMTDEDKRKVLAFVREDILNMDYEEFKFGGWSKPIGFRSAVYGSDDYYSKSINININANFEKTVAYLVEKGHGEKLFATIGDFAVISADDWRKYMDVDEDEVFVDDYLEKAAYSKESPKLSDFPNARRITSPEEKKALQSFVLGFKGRYKPSLEAKYYVCRIDDQGYLNQIASIFEENEEIKKFM